MPSRAGRIGRTLALAVAWIFTSTATLWAGTIDAGTDHSIAIKDDGSVWTWGDNSHGQRGNGTSGTGTGSLIPVSVSGLNAIASVAAGQDFSVALDESGNVYTWGDDVAGQLGDGTVGGGNRTTPYQVTTLSGITAIAAGTQHVLALKNDGTVWAWGLNANGRLGDDTTQSRATPVQVKLTAGTFLTGIASVACGDAHSLAVTSSGAAYAWGKNSNGQIGINNVTTPQKLPKQVLGVGGSGTLANVASVAAALNSSFARLANGTVFSWGSNTNGVLGDGTPTQRTTPVQVKGVGGAGTLTNVQAIVAGDLHALAVKNDGTLWAWGKGTNGQRGNNTTTATQSTPVQVKDTPGTGVLTNVVAAAGGVSFSLAVTTDSGGTAWGWGLNTLGQVGDNSQTQRNTPRQIGTGFAAGQVAAPVFDPAANTFNEEQNVAITSTTSGATIRYTTNGDPVDLGSTVLPAGQTVAVASSLTLKAKAWASSGTASEEVLAAYVLKVATPVVLPSLSGPHPAPITVSISQSGASVHYTTNGSEPTTGSTLYSVAFSLGTATTVKAKGFRAGWTDSETAAQSYTFNFQTLAAPQIAPQSENYISSATVTMSSISGATIRYTMDGSEPDLTSQPYVNPLIVDIAMTVKARAWHPDWQPSPTAQQSYTIQTATPAVTPDGGTFTNPQTVLISTTTSDASVRYTTNGADPGLSDPAVANGTLYVDRSLTLKARAFKAGVTPSGVKVSDFTIDKPLVAAGNTHSFFVKPDGSVWGWGNNSDGQLGKGDIGGDPLQPLSIPGLTGVEAIAAGVEHTVFLKTDGTVWAAGSSRDGQLGNGQSGLAAPNQPTPIQVRQDATTYLTSVVAVAAGDYFSLGLKADGGVWAWGRNSNGQVGNGTPTLAPYAVQVKAGCRAIGAGSAFSVAVDAQGRVWAWGQNAFGQVGDGTSGVDRLSPVQVVGLTNVVSVTAGSTFSIALRGDGTVWSWGENWIEYLLGDGTQANRSTPVQVLGLTGVVAIASEWRHSMALKSDGTIWTWGRNPFGELGYATPTPQTIPKAVPGMSGVISIATAASHSLAITADHAVWGWGKNWNGYYGHLGDGSGRSTRTSPALLMDPGLLPKSATPTLSPEGANLGFGGSPITLTGLTGTEIHYTTDGSDPDQSDPLASPSGTVINVSSTTTLKARSWAATRNPSNIAVEIYDVKLWTPGFSPNPGQYPSSPQLVTISHVSNPSDTEYWYTTDGTPPQQSGPTSTRFINPISITSATTFKAKAFKAGLTPSDEVTGAYTFNYGTVATPTVTPGGGTHPGPLNNVQLDTTTPDPTTIRCTLDGSNPTTLSPDCSAPFSIPNSLLLKARAWKTDWTPSGILVADYTITYANTVATPTISLASSTPGTPYTAAQTATLSCTTSNAEIRYTTDGTTPSRVSTLYTVGQPLIIDRGMTLLARGFLTGWTDSGNAAATYVFALPAPLADPAGGSAPQTVTVTQATPGSTIHYTLDSAEPGLQDGVIASGGTLPIDGTRTLKLKAWKDGWTTSPTTTHQYVVGASTVDAPRFWPSAGSSATAQSVVIWSTTPRVVVRYTTDGSDPTHRSPVAQGKILVAESSTLTAKAFKAGFTASAPTAAVYTIALANTVAVPSLSLASRAYTTTQKSVAACATTGAVIRYTLNGADPTESDPVAPAGGIVVAEPATVKVRGFKAGMTPSAVRTVVYNITGTTSAGGQISMAVKGSGELFAWGNGPLGRGVSEQQLTPVSIGPYLQNVIAVSLNRSSSGHVLALDANGQVWGWGANGSGQATAVVGSTVLTPTAVAGLTSVIAIAAGGSHSLALKADGTVWGWGSNFFGQIGVGGPGFARQIQTSTGPLQGIVDIAAVSEHSVALNSDGIVWSWGTNARGQAGIGTANTQVNLAVQASGLTGVSAVGASSVSTFALKTDGGHEGTLYGWGGSFEGSLGNGIHEFLQGLPLLYNQLTPAPIGTLPLLRTLSHSMTLMAALEADGRGGYALWAWGNNSGGGVGDGTQTHRYVPVRSAFQSAVGVSAGSQHVLARTHDGTL